jgi:hypothetical protein
MKTAARKRYLVWLPFVVTFSLGDVDHARAQSVCAQPPQGLISWWAAEEDATDIVGSNHGTLENGANFGAGKVGKAFQFDGVNDFVKVPYAANLSTWTQLSIEFWMKGDVANAMNNCCQGLVGTDFYKLEGFDYDRGLAFVFSMNGGSTYVGAGTLWGAAYPSGFGLTPGQWHHVAGTSDGALLKLYVDGQLRSAMVQLNSISPMLTSSFLAFGSEDGDSYNASGTANRYFHGLIDEVSIYNRALSSEEISAIFAAGESGKCKGKPFVNFSPSLQISIGAVVNDDSFDFSATAKEASGSDGISPLNEPVGLRIGNYSIVIPPGSFVPSRNGRQLTSSGIINGTQISATFSESKAGQFTVRIKGTGANLAGIASPVNVALAIGVNGVVATLTNVQINAN